MEADLEVFLRGRRTYIQGSLILSLTAAWPGLRLGLDGPVLLHEASFTSLKNCGVRAVLAAEDLGGFGTARFSVGGTNRTVRFVSVEETSPPRVGDEPTKIDRLVITAGLNGEAIAAVGGGFGDLLCAVIEANKRIHERVSEDVSDVWFTGLRKAAIPTDTGGIPDRVRLSFTSLMQRRQGAQRQSLSRVEVFGDGNIQVVPAFLCSFAYKA